MQKRGSRKQLVTHSDSAGIIPYPSVLKHRYDEGFILAEKTLAELLLLRKVRELVIAALVSPPSLHLFVVVEEILAEFLLLGRARVLVIAVLALPPPPPPPPFQHTHLPLFAFVADCPHSQSLRVCNNIYIIIFTFLNV